MAKQGINFGQMPLFKPVSDWMPPDLNSLPDWGQAKRIGFDTETCDKHLRKLGCGVRRGGYIVGASVAIEDGPKFYLPWAHEGGDNLPKENCLRYLRAQAKTFTGEVCGANLAYDLDYSLEAGIDFPVCKGYRDIQIADAIIGELELSYSMENIAHRWEFEGKFESMLYAGAEAYSIPVKEVKQNIYRLPARYVGAYAVEDADLPLKILRKQERRIEEDDANDERVSQLGADKYGLRRVYDLESKLLPILVRMRRRGVAVDMDRLDQVERWLAQRERDNLAEVRRLTGFQIPFGAVMTASKLKPALEQAGFKVSTTSDGNDSVTNEALDSSDNPVAKLISFARKVNKIRTTFVASLREYEVGGRIHCTFHQMRKTEDDRDKEAGAKYGRMSCTDPNLQQQPSGSRATTDDEILLAVTWRSVYRPDTGMWASCDLKQQEPKWSFHFSSLLRLPKAAEVCQMLRDDPTMDTYIPIVKVANVKRGIAKIIWLARCYGQGEGTMCEALGLPTEMVIWDRDAHKPIAYETPRGRELARKGGRVYKGAGEAGKAIIDAVDSQLPFLKQAAKIAKQRAEERGYVTTYLGRRCHFPQRENGQYDFAHKAFNRIIQGSAAEQTKEIVIALNSAGHELQLQVHDEVTASVRDKAHAEEIAAIMRTAVPSLLVPTVVDIETGPSWGESMKYKDKPFVWSLG